VSDMRVFDTTAFHSFGLRMSGHAYPYDRFERERWLRPASPKSPCRFGCKDHLVDAWTVQAVWRYLAMEQELRKSPDRRKPVDWQMAGVISKDGKEP
jgi:hypothetical protein